MKIKRYKFKSVHLDGIEFEYYKPEDVWALETDIQEHKKKILSQECKIKILEAEN